MRFDVHTIWARNASTDDVWIVDAWDEFTIDDNHAGWVEALDKAKAAHDEVRVVIICVTHEAVVNAFEPARIDGEVRA